VHARHPGRHQTLCEPEDHLGQLQASLITALAASQRLRPVDVGSLDERRLWRACELCTYLEYRLPGAPDPRSMTDAAIWDWSRRGLASGERLGDPAELGDYFPYWLVIDGSCVGSLALALQDPGWGESFLWVASLYLFKEWRRHGYGGVIMAELEALAA
jgi:GNAT superfamily N-acetyltransferase